MEIVWVFSNSSSAPALPPHWQNAIALPASELLNARLFPDGAGILIVETAGEANADEAPLLIEEFRERARICIFDPGASVAASLRWMKAGAAHLATSMAEVEDYVDSVQDINPVPAVRFGSLIGRSQAIRSIEASIQMVAGRRCSVLLEGETGTGKEVVAREIHSSGPRSRAPWVAVNCSAIPEALLEAELFGHVKGAFTGAIQARAGKFEAANHGTIFLDEIGDMPMSVQSRLLRVLQEREVERLGGNERIRLDVRVIAATNVNLAARVKEGLFRQDLYYRLNVFRIELSPLRERLEDVAVLAQHFLDKVCAAERLPGKSLDRSAMDRLKAHSWPGNVRELENAIESAVVVSGDRAVVFPSDLRLTRPAMPAQPAGRGVDVPLPAGGLDYQRTLEDFEKNLLTQALKRARGNKTAAADLLGLKRTTLAAKMRALESRLPSLVA